MFEKKSIKFDGEDAILITGLGPYNLTDTMECGQCFRYERVNRPDGTAEFVTLSGNTLIRVAQEKAGELIFPGMKDEVFETVARPYFSLDLDLNEVRADITAKTDSDWLKEAAEFASGIAILKQDPWESLVSFIISQNNNIPRIKKIVREICSHYGTNLTLENDNNSCPIGLIEGKPCKKACSGCGRCYTFPSADDILADPDGLLPSKPGFRYPYILDAADAVVNGRVDFSDISAHASYEYTVAKLKEIKGVGDKVASCVALFGLSNLEAFPIDVWMKRAIDTYFNGSLDPTTLGKYAGVAQQYIFHYIRHTSK